MAKALIDDPAQAVFLACDACREAGNRQAFFLLDAFGHGRRQPGNRGGARIRLNLGHRLTRTAATKDD